MKTYHFDFLNTPVLRPNLGLRILVWTFNQCLLNDFAVNVTGNLSVFRDKNIGNTSSIVLNRIRLLKESILFYLCLVLIFLARETSSRTISFNIHVTFHF